MHKVIQLTAIAVLGVLTVYVGFRFADVVWERPLRVTDAELQPYEDAIRSDHPDLSSVEVRSENVSDGLSDDDIVVSIIAPHDAEFVEDDLAQMAEGIRSDYANALVSVTVTASDCGDGECEADGFSSYHWESDDVWETYQGTD